MEILTGDGHVRLVKLKDIFSQNEWTGHWSKASDKWTSALREQLGYTEEE